MQTWFAKKVVNIVNEKINGEATIDKALIVFFNRVILENVTIAGDQRDTLAHFDKLTVNVSPAQLLIGNLKINRVTLKNGVFNFITESEDGESNLTRIFNFGPSESDSTSTIPAMSLSELRLVNFTFKFYDPFMQLEGQHPSSMNYSDLSISDITGRFTKMSFKEGVISANINNLTAKDKCGLFLKELKGNVTLDSKRLNIDKLILKDEFSSIDADYLTFSYDSPAALSDFLNEICLAAKFNNSRLDFRTIGKFAPELIKNRLILLLTGEVKGTVANLVANDLLAETPSGKTKALISGSMVGLPDITKTIFNLSLKELYTETNELAEIIGYFAEGIELKNITSISPNVRYALQGDVNGSFEEMKAIFTLNSVNGGGHFNVRMKNNHNGLALKGDISTQNLDVGAILNQKSFGKVTLFTKAAFNIPKSDDMNIIIDTLHISRFGFNGYDYSDITALGEYSKDKFDGRIICHDPNLHFILQGVSSISKKNTQGTLYNLYADIPFADLSALNLDKRDEVSQISSFTLMANVSNNLETKYMLGNVNIKSLSYKNSNGDYSIGPIMLKASSKQENYKINLDSPFLKADFTSTKSPDIFIANLMDVLLYDQFGNVFTPKEGDEVKESGDFNFKMRTFDMTSICQILMPGLYIADGTTLNLDLNRNKDLNIRLKSNFVGLKTAYIKNLDLSVANPSPLLISKISCEKIASGSFGLDNNSIKIEVNEGVANLYYNFSNNGEHKDQLFLSSDIFFSKNQLGELMTNIYINESELFIHGHQWTFNPSIITLGKDEYRVDKFSLNNGQQHIIIDGAVSKKPEDILQVILNNFDISILNSFTNDQMGLSGSFTGNANLMDLYGDLGITMDIKGSNIALMERQVGSLNLMSKWDKSKKRFNVLVNNKFKERTPLNIIGYYQPDNQFINFNIALAEFSLSYIEPFTKDFLVNTGGSISGDLELIGTFDKMNLTSYNTKFNKFAFTPLFTNVPYTLDGPIELTESGVTFMNVQLVDQYNQKGSINGGLNYRFFKDFSLDTKLTFKELQCLNTREKDNESFYGSAYGTGSVTLSGPFDNLFIDATFTTTGKSAIHIPLASSTSAKKTNLLSFTSEEDLMNPIEAEFISPKKGNNNNKSQIDIRAKANITNSTELFIEIDKEVGDIMKCSGNGAIDLEINPSRDILDIRGDYTVNEGSYKFVFLGLVPRDFIINPGGNITFNGDIPSTNLNLGATYRTKASISTLISDTTAVGNRRTVDCGINMTGSLTNPQIKFSIDIPDLDPITKGRVESALSTDDKVLTQFTSLLVTGSFMADEQSSIVNNTTVLYSNASEILSNQFNNIFRQLGIPLDLGLNYQRGETGKDVFDVALSYQAFDNRVIINGNVGTSQKSSNWMGNFEAELKLNKSGKTRMNIFTRAADDYSNYLDNTQRNGLGFTYQDEFDTFGELFRSIFVSKRRREEIEMKAILEADKILQKEEEEAASRKKEILKPKEVPYRFY